tara:strand:+ start:556 stop:759 length:204 start_codon:yes stop_codon:yes gene_type:complete
MSGGNENYPIENVRDILHSINTKMSVISVEIIYIKSEIMQIKELLRPQNDFVSVVCVSESREKRRKS